jgi:tetratricopeptide (TPR) repeat protein/ADP-heptose:LPS heptosyltransferase
MNNSSQRRVVDLLSQAVTLHQAGRLADACRLYHQILQCDSRQPDALHLLGVAAQQQGRHDEAIHLIQRAIALCPDRWAFHTNLACALQDVARYDDAIASCRRAIELGGESAALLSNLGAAFQAAGRRDEAEQSYRRALQLDASHAEAHYNLGNLLRESGRPDLALTCYESALRHKPNYPDAHVNLANLLQDQGHLAEAVRAYRFALELDDRHPEAHYNLARALAAQDDCAAALREYQRAIEHKPDHAAAHLLRGLLLLADGNFAEGWKEYAWRWRITDQRPLRSLPQPLWQGQPLDGKTLLVYCEQDLVDDLLFATCLPDVVDQAEHCIIECDPRLVPLYRRSFARATIQPHLGWDDHSWLSQVRPLDYQVPIGNLPGILRTRLEDFPARQGFLIPDVGLIDRWRDRFDQLGPGPKIGIAWRDAADHRQKQVRSIPLAAWAPILSLDGFCFVNLQGGNVTAEVAQVEDRLGISIHDWEDADPRRDLDGLAAQMAALDLVITVGNINAHLAGALGVPVWTLVPYPANWRWMKDRGDSPWYPSMRLFREQAAGNDALLLAEVRQALLAWCPSASSLPPLSSARQALPACQTSLPPASGQAPAIPTALLKKRRASITDARWGLYDASIQEAFARAVQFQSQGEPHQAEGILREILRHAPKQPDTLHRLGCLLKEKGRRDEALPYLREAAAIAAAKPNFHFDLAVALSEAHLNQEAERELWRVIELDPNQGPAYVNLGVIFERLGKLSEALAICQRGLALMPESPQAHYNLANVYLHHGRVFDAINHYDQVIALSPEFYKAHWNRGLAHLLMGDFATGWTGYEYREAAEQVQLDKFSLPKWDGSPLTGKTLLVHAEQGVGDEIMFGTCLPDVVAQAKHVHLTCDPRLEKLFARSFPSIEVHPVLRGPTFNWKPPAGIDLYIHAGSLPRFLRPDWASFPRQQKLLTPDPAAVDAWKARYAELGPGPKIGISWRAGGVSTEQRRRTSLLDHWQPLFRLTGCHFINLQYGDWSQDLAAAKARWGVTIHDWDDSDPLSDLDDFAAQIAALDAVVSVGNTTIHMAGALGAPTWAVLPRVPGWRYLLNHDWLPWYASVRLRRQQVDGDWDHVYAQVAQELREFLEHGPVDDSVSVRSHSATPPIQNSAAAARNEHRSEPGGVLPRCKIGEAFIGALKQHRAGRLVEAENVYRQILQIEPRHADALHLLGVIAHQTGRLPLALEAIGQAIQCCPDNSVYHYNFASTLRDAGQAEEAILHLQRATSLNPHLAEAHLNLGALLHAKGQCVEAMSAYERALAIRPDYAEAHNNMGSALRDLGRYDQAIACYQRAVEIRPGYADAHLHLAGVLREVGRPDDALASFDRGIELNPQNADAHVNRAMLRIQQCRFVEGWEEWEWRWQTRGGPQRRPFLQPPWDGGSLRAKTILVHMEQGVGDEIMLASCLGEIIDQAQRAIVECDPRLAPLLARSFPAALVQPREAWNSATWLAHVGPIDFQIPAGSLPRLLRRELRDFPRQTRYLLPDARRVRHWQAELARLGPGLKLGISWRGGLDNFEGRQRSTSLDAWLPLTQIEGVQFVNLQYGDCQADLEAARRLWPRPLHSLSINLREELDDLAALIAALDLVISVSNVTVHLAGAVGTPTWALLTRAPSWRWMSGLDEAPWYRSVRFIRQGIDGRWEPVFREALSHLAALVEANRHRGGPRPHATFPLASPNGFVER